MCCDRTALVEQAGQYAKLVARAKSEAETARLLANPPRKLDIKPGFMIGRMSDHHLCIDCGFNTAPGCPDRIESELNFIDGGAGQMQHFSSDSEIYMVRDKVWRAAGMGDWDGCLCIGCLERRIGRRLRPKDFSNHVFNEMPGTERLLKRRGGGL